LVPRFDIDNNHYSPIFFNHKGDLLELNKSATDFYTGIIIDGRSSLLKASSGENSLLFLDKNGNLDNSFNNDSPLILEDIVKCTGLDYFKVCAQNNNIYLIGSSRLNNCNKKIIARYLGNGALDTSFGKSGVIYVEDYAPFLKVTDVIEQEDGRIIVGGYGNEANLIRFKAEGFIDNSFGENGVIQFRADYRSTCEQIAIINGDILFVGHQSSGNDVNNVFVARLKIDGETDEDFYGEGHFSISIKGKIHFKNMLIDENKITILCHIDVDAPLHNKAAMTRIIHNV